MNAKLTKEQLQAVTKSEDFKLLAQNVFVAMANAQLIKEKVDSYAIPLFRSMNLVEDKTQGDEPGKLIDDPKDAYLALDSNGKNLRLDRYYHLLHLDHIKHGFSIDQPGNCPALKAEHDQTKAENKLLKYMEENITMPEWERLEDRQTMLKVYLSLAEPLGTRIGTKYGEKIKTSTFTL